MFPSIQIRRFVFLLHIPAILTTTT